MVAKADSSGWSVAEAGGVGHRASGAGGDTVVQPGDDGHAMAALVVDQEQCVVRGQVAQVSRTDHRGRVADWLRVDVEGGYQGPPHDAEIRFALVDELFGAQHVDGDDGFGDRARLRASAGDDDPLFVARLVFGDRFLVRLRQEWIRETADCRAPGEPARLSIRTSRRRRSSVPPTKGYINFRHETHAGVAEEETKRNGHQGHHLYKGGVR